MRCSATCAVVAVLIAASAAAQTSRPTSRPFVPAKDTTVVTGPLRPDGTIDYVAALNAICAKGVTRENNAAVPLLEVFEADGEKNASALSRQRAMLGVKPAPTPLTPLRNYAESNWKEGDTPDWHEAEDKLEELTKGTWKAEQLRIAAKWLEAMRQPLDRVVEGSKRDHFDIPHVSDVEPATILHIQYAELGPMRGAVKALRARALLRLGAGDFNAFRADANAILRLGRLASAGPTLVEKLVAIGCEAVGFETLRSAVRAGALSAEQCETLAADFRALPPASPMAECFATGERFMLLDYLDMFAIYGPVQAARMIKGETKNLRPVDTSATDWNAAFRKANGWYDRLVEAGRKPTFAGRAAACAAIDADLDKLRVKWSGLAGPFAPIEDRMITIMLPSTGRAYQAETRRDVDEDLTLLALALRAYRTREGHYPQKLDALTPRYLKSVPLDRFSEKPLAYKPNEGGFLVYSVGPDGVDSNGESHGRLDDVAIRVGAAH